MRFAYPGYEDPRRCEVRSPGKAEGRTREGPPAQPDLAFATNFHRTLRLTSTRYQPAASSSWRVWSSAGRATMPPRAPRLTS